MDEDITEWMLEFVLRSTSDVVLHKKLLHSFSCNSRMSPRLTKTIALRSIASEIEDAVVSETILENLEIIDEVDRFQGRPILESMKKAYCAVAVECSTRYLCISYMNREYLESIKRVWRERMKNLEKSGISELLCDELIEAWEELEAAVWDENVCSRLQERNTRNAALISVRAYLEEAFQSMGPAILELGSQLMHIVHDGQVHHRANEEDALDGSDCTTEEKDPIPDRRDEEKTSSQEVRRVVEALRDSSMELRAAVTDPLPEALRVAEAIAQEMAGKNALGEVVDAEEALDAGRAKEATNPMPSSSRLNMSKRSLMERNGTAQTYEWDEDEDEDDDEDASRTRSKRIRLSTPVITNVSPLRKPNLPKTGARRNPRKWSLQEEEALMEGVKKYGKGNWTLIFTAMPGAFDNRTVGDLKDKWRNLTKLY